MIKLQTIQTQRQILAPTLQQSIAVLMLPVLDLKISIDQELQANPLLEIDEQRKTEEPEWVFEEIKHIIKTRENTPEYGLYSSGNDAEPDDQTAALGNVESLEDSLLRQLRFEISDPQEIKIGEFIIGNINEDGYLTATCEEIAELLRIPDHALIEKVLRVIQSFDPLGIASRDLRECLLCQIHEKLNGYSGLAAQIVQDHLNELGQKKYAAIARNLGVGVEKIQETARAIATLEPRPARNFRPLTQNTYIIPDAYILQNEHEELLVYINKEDVPPLRINPFYKKLLRENNLRQDEKEFIREKMKNALLFIKSVDQRGHTLRAISEYILEKQKDFFKEGHMSLVPMSLKDIAQAVNRNESTISRAINNKYIETPKGLLPMKFFFSQAVGAAGQDSRAAVSNRSIKEEIRDLIEAEDKSSPLSDQEIQRYFEEKSMPVARRTISKYRQQLKILPSHLRKG